MFRKFGAVTYANIGRTGTTGKVVFAYLSAKKRALEENISCKGQQLTVSDWVSKRGIVDSFPFHSHFQVNSTYFSFFPSSLLSSPGPSLPTLDRLAKRKGEIFHDILEIKSQVSFTSLSFANFYLPFPS